MAGEKAEEEKEEIMTFFLVDLYNTKFQGINNYCLLKVKFDM